MADRKKDSPRADGSATAGFLNTDWTPRDLPEGVTTRNVVLRTADQAATSGTLYRPSNGSDTVVCIMHPREFMACHYLIPDITAAGYAAWSQSPRSVGNDLRLEHEIVLFDVAVALSYLKSAGFRRIILLGNSGGASLYALYNQQSQLAPENRLARTPGGRPTNLATLEMPVVDGMILVAPHPGQGMLLLGGIDPSVTDESDAFSVDSALDPFDPANGFVDPPGSSKYSEDFIGRYRAAQRARVARLDAIAREMIAERMAARKRAKEGGSALDRRKGAHTQIITIWRTDADPHCFDLSMDPSDRKVGTLWGRDPMVSNYGSVGFARLCSPESWLSTWSGITSKAALHLTAPSIGQPALLVEYTGDVSTFPATIKGIFGAIATSDKTHLRIRGDHHGRALTADEEPGRYIAGRAIADWLRDKFPQ